METQLQQRAFLLLLGLVTLVFFWLLLPFYGVILWAVILAILFRPLQGALEVRLGERRNLAAAISVLACVLLVVVPVTLIVAGLIEQGTALVQQLQASHFTVPDALASLSAHLPGWARRVIAEADLATVQEQLAGAVRQATQYLAAQALNVGQNTLRFVANLGIMLYVLFFLFGDGPQIGLAIRSAIPLSPAVIDALIACFTEVVRATVWGSLIIATVQGAIGGVTFWLIDIPAPLLWGTVMAFLSLLPAVGPALVWGPVAAYLLLNGDYVTGGILVFVGVAVIGLVDNLLRPLLVGKETRLSDYVVLVSTLGGLVLFGINGFVVGPLIAALFVACWTLFRDGRAVSAV